MFTSCCGGDVPYIVFCGYGAIIIYIYVCILEVHDFFEIYIICVVYLVFISAAPCMAYHHDHPVGG